MRGCSFFQPSELVEFCYSLVSAYFHDNNSADIDNDDDCDGDYDYDGKHKFGDLIMAIERDNHLEKLIAIHFVVILNWDMLVACGKLYSPNPSTKIGLLITVGVTESI